MKGRLRVFARATVRPRTISPERASLLSVPTRTALCSLMILPVVTCWIGCQLPGTGSAAGGSNTQELDSLKVADTGFTAPPVETQRESVTPVQQRGYELAILHVLIPRAGLGEAAKVWNYVREDVFGADAQLRFRENGLRVGVGHAQWWEPIKAVLDAIEGHKVTMATPVRLPLGYPLLLELDVEPQLQTLFYVGRDGVLTGNTWPESRNVLRIAYAPDMEQAGSVILHVIPEVHRQERNWEWIRAEAGLRADPKQSMESFHIVGIAASLGPGEFLLLTPSENAGVYGLLGGAFLTRVSQGEHYSSFVFLRPEARQIGKDD